MRYKIIMDSIHGLEFAEHAVILPNLTIASEGQEVNLTDVTLIVLEKGSKDINIK